MSKHHNKPKRCNKHNVTLEASKTRFGTRYDCPVDGCTVMSWSGNTSTPADQETRTARSEAHKAFDVIWKEGQCSRGHAYKLLAERMGLKPKKAHIGMFNLHQCREVIKHAAEIKKGLKVDQKKLADVLGSEVVKPEDMTQKERDLMQAAGRSRRLVEATDHNLATQLIAAMRKRIAHNRTLLANYYVDDSLRDKSQAFISVEDAARIRGETLALIGVLNECNVDVGVDGVEASGVRLLEGGNRE